MRWVTYVSAGVERPGLLHDGAIHGLRDTARLLDVLGDLPASAERAITDPLEVVVDPPLRAPIPIPPSVRDFYAFEQHVVTAHRSRGRTVDPSWYEFPAFYFTNPAAIAGPRDDIAISPGSTQFDYELEIAAVVGRGGSDIPPSRAEEHIAGYTVFADWSARDIQARERGVGLGPVKAKDSATSLGPYLVTPDELADKQKGHAYDLAMTATVNGKPYSAGNFADIYWSYGEMLGYASRGTELRAGDVIGSGTVGTGCILELSLVHGSEKFPWLNPGDRVTLEIERLGRIETTIRPPRPIIPLRSART
jgi:2-keto-4-pentenoate hydratase/2-oxohepta-3-ene-1,7-dioic acid hydratase in catechol pathway